MWIEAVLVCCMTRGLLVTTMDPREYADLTTPLRSIGEGCGYERCPAARPDALNIHIVPHSHAELGYEKYFEDHFTGENEFKYRTSPISMKRILDAVITELWQTEHRTFTFSDLPYFFHWWSKRDPTVRRMVYTLVRQGRFNFAGGGWGMSDEATTNYQMLIDSYTYGLRKLNSTFSECGRPLVAWQSHVYGHSKVFASLMAQMGFDGLFISPISVDEELYRMSNASLEFIWRGNDDLGLESDIFTHKLFDGFESPPGFCFSSMCSDPLLIVSDKTFTNVDERVSSFLTATMHRQSPYYRTQHILVMMGGSRMYHDAQMWFRNVERLIEHTNAQAAEQSLAVRAYFSSPACYLKGVHASSPILPVKQDDFLPHRIENTSYASGLFTSRPTLKYMIVEANRYIQIAKQLQVTARLPANDWAFEELSWISGVIQDHKIISGASSQYAIDHYNHKLYLAVQRSTLIFKQGVNTIRGSSNTIIYYRCDFNSSSCHTAYIQSFFLIVYNPLAWHVTIPVRLPVKAGRRISITDPKGRDVPSYLMKIPDPVLDIPNRYSEADEEVVFMAERLPPLGFRSYFCESERARVKYKRSVDDKLEDVEGNTRFEGIRESVNDNLEVNHRFEGDKEDIDDKHKVDERHTRFESIRESVGNQLEVNEGNKSFESIRENIDDNLEVNEGNTRFEVREDIGKHNNISTSENKELVKATENGIKARLEEIKERDINKLDEDPAKEEFLIYYPDDKSETTMEQDVNLENVTVIKVNDENLEKNLVSTEETVTMQQDHQNKIPVIKDESNDYKKNENENQKNSTEINLGKQKLVSVYQKNMTNQTIHEFKENIQKNGDNSIRNTEQTLENDNQDTESPTMVNENINNSIQVTIVETDKKINKSNQDSNRDQFFNTDIRINQIDKSLTNATAADNVLTADFNNKSDGLEETLSVNDKTHINVNTVREHTVDTNQQQVTEIAVEKEKYKQLDKMTGDYVSRHVQETENDRSSNETRQNFIPKNKTVGIPGLKIDDKEILTFKVGNESYYEDKKITNNVVNDTDEKKRFIEQSTTHRDIDSNKTTNAINDTRTKTVRKDNNNDIFNNNDKFAEKLQTDSNFDSQNEIPRIDMFSEESIFPREYKSEMLEETYSKTDRNKNFVSVSDNVIYYNEETDDNILDSKTDLGTSNTLKNHNNTTTKDNEIKESRNDFCDALNKNYNDSKYRPLDVNSRYANIYDSLCPNNIDNLAVNLVENGHIVANQKNNSVVQSNHYFNASKSSENNEEVQLQMLMKAYLEKFNSSLKDVEKDETENTTSVETVTKKPDDIKINDTVIKEKVSNETRENVTVKQEKGKNIQEKVDNRDDVVNITEESDIEANKSVSLYKFKNIEEEMKWYRRILRDPDLKYETPDFEKIRSYQKQRPRSKYFRKFYTDVSIDEEEIPNRSISKTLNFIDEDDDSDSFETNDTIKNENIKTCIHKKVAEKIQLKDANDEETEDATEKLNRHEDIENSNADNCSKTHPVFKRERGDTWTDDPYLRKLAHLPKLNPDPEIEEESDDADEDTNTEKPKWDPRMIPGWHLKQQKQRNNLAIRTTRKPKRRRPQRVTTTRSPIQRTTTMKRILYTRRNQIQPLRTTEKDISKGRKKFPPIRTTEAGFKPTRKPQRIATNTEGNMKPTRKPDNEATNTDDEFEPNKAMDTDDEIDVKPTRKTLKVATNTAAYDADIDTDENDNDDEENDDDDTENDKYIENIAKNENKKVVKVKKLKPPKGITTEAPSARRMLYENAYDEPPDAFIENQYLRLSIDPKSRRIVKLNLSNGVQISLGMQFYFYEADDPANSGREDIRPPGAQVFRALLSTPRPINDKFTSRVYKNLLVQELHLTYSEWMSAAVRVYNNSPVVEVDWLAGPVPLPDGIGREIFVRYKTDLDNNGVFFTDSNGRQNIKRIRNKRPAFQSEYFDPVAGNIYPVTSKISIRDIHKNIRFTVFNDRSQGGTSLNDGEIDLFLHRRLLTVDDVNSRAILNETEEELPITVRGTHHLYLTKANYKPNKLFEKKYAKEIVLQPQVYVSGRAPGNKRSLWLNYNNEFKGIRNKLPFGVHILTLERIAPNTLLIRLENYLERNEMINAKPKKVYLRKLLTNIEITSIRETTLAANQYLNEAWTPLQWNREAPFYTNFNSFYGTGEAEYNDEEEYRPLEDDREMLKDGVWLKPQQIRTFIAKYDLDITS